jgi:hypothetical protein
VVEVLEAVHLLLGMRLFVVIVAVDSRWLVGSLHEHYGRLLPIVLKPNGGSARLTTPRQFLEKIFQIPFVIPPLEPELFSRMVQLLVPVEAVSPTSYAMTRRQDAASSTAPTPQVGSQTATTTPSTASTSPNEAHSNTTPNIKELSLRSEALPAEMKLTLDERSCIEQLAPLVQTPRGLKSLINIYRILRVGLQGANAEVASLNNYLRTREYRITLLLLAIQIGEPLLAQRMYREMLSLRSGQPLPSLAAFLESFVTSSAAWHKIPVLARALLEPQQLEQTITIYEHWLQRVRRFSFESWAEESLPTASAQVVPSA